MYLQMYVFQNSLPPSDPHADDCLFGIYGDEVGLQGQALQVNSYLTAVHNDLQKMVNSNSSDTKVVDNVAEDLNSILDELNGKVGALPQAMDPTALTNMISSDTALRNEFWVYGDTSGYNPAWNPNPEQGGYTYHFFYRDGTPPGDTWIETFADMETYMKQTGDPQEATEAYKNLTDNLNADTGMSQTVNSEINEKINQLTNFIKTLLGFYENGLLQPSMKLTNVAIQNQSKGS
jgi:archaellum component FlaC